ncbi:Retinaldehyde-binding protein 1-like protein 2 [Zootermopsis nevadensis]|uniref:Retinaldehyde-binding protein 1-like protein 2 n=1 Tax=Zootermopsis nevadensis TaxID=136037 RepID=A0A067RJF7_ZOONE|nr:Retinaldehyde-binding protein 1-like protein 2 [Zootermopsis nevadensis]
MALPPLDERTKQAVLAEIGLNKDSLKEAVRVLKEWLEQQPHLPSECDEGRLERRFVWCKASLERTKSAIDMYYTLRAVVPEILSNRDPFSPWFRQITSVSYCLPLPTLTDDCHRVVVLGNLDPDASKYNVLDVFKLIFMVGDVRFSEDCCVADTYIVDMTNFGVGHIAKITMPAVKKLEICAIKGYSARIRAIHYVNVPRYADVLINLVRSVMKPKIASRMQVHTKGMNTLHKEIDRKILPEEFGGQAGSISDLWTMWKQKLGNYREWFLEQENVKVDESKRPGESFNTSDLFGFEGSFRQLNVD